MTDAEFVLDCLGRGGWWSLNDLLRASLAVRGCGLTVHSRVSDLRAQGHVVEHRMVGRRGDGSQYRLRETAEGGDSQARRRRVTGCRQVAEAAEADTDSGFMAGGRTVVGGLSEPVQLQLVPEPPRGAYHKDAA